MNELTSEQCDAWRRRHRIAIGADGRPKTRHREAVIAFPLPERARDQIILADGVAAGLGQEEALVQFVGWPMFSRREMQIFQAWRERHGCPSRLIDAPGFEFSNGLDNETGRALLLFLLAYRWEAQILTTTGDVFLCIQPYSVEVTVRRGADASAWSESLAVTGLLPTAV
jgi:hypothetical protein